MKNLISMTDFVLNVKLNDTMDKDLADIYKDYANFLKQPLELWMFVPCDDNDNVLEEPYGYDLWISGIVSDMSEYLKYQQAKERCLFERFEAMGGYCVLNSNLMIHFLNNKISIEEHFEEIITKLGKEISTIEDLIKYKLTLTQTAIKQLSL